MERNQTILTLLWPNIKFQVIVMNIDGLHKPVGSDALEMHGGLSKDD